MSRKSMQRQAAGIFIGRDRVAVARLRVNGAGWTVASLGERALASALYGAAPVAETENEIAAALDALAGDLSARHVPVHVSLPDPAFRAAVLELDDLPKSRAMQLQLVEFRLRRSAARPGELCCDCQSFGRIGDRHVLLALAIEAAWRDVVRSALARAGVVAWTLTPAAARPFNLFHESLVRDGGAMVSLAADSWSLWLWGPDGIVRHVRSHWRQGAGGGEAAGDLDDIAGEVGRAIVAYADADRTHSIGSINVFGGAEAQALAATLDRRSSRPCVRLSSESLLSGSEAAAMRERPEQPHEDAAPGIEQPLPYGNAVSHALAAAMSA